jgi:hypothetical protein
MPWLRQLGGATRDNWHKHQHAGAMMHMQELTCMTGCFLAGELHCSLWSLPTAGKELQNQGLATMVKECRYCCCCGFICVYCWCWLYLRPAVHKGSQLPDHAHQLRKQLPAGGQTDRSGEAGQHDHGDVTAMIGQCSQGELASYPHAHLFPLP